MTSASVCLSNTCNRSLISGSITMTSVDTRMSARCESPLYADICRLNALHARARHVRPRLAERAARIDTECGVLVYHRLAPCLTWIEYLLRILNVGGN